MTDFQKPSPEALWSNEKTIEAKYGLPRPWLRRKRWELKKDPSIKETGPPFAKCEKRVLYYELDVHNWLLARRIGSS